MAVLEFINRPNLSLDGMRKNLIYITNEEKTLQGKYIYGFNCDANNAYEDFCITKEMYHKTSGRQHIHFTQSFQGEEASYELAHEIGRKLLENEIFQGFQVVMTTHVDTYNTHNHFVLNTVNMEDGKKWKLSRSELEDLKAFSDELCMEHSLSVIDRTYKTTKEYTTIKKENSKQYETYVKVLEASRQARSKEEFEKLLHSSGKKLHWDAGEYFSKNQKLENILNACKYHAKDVEEFIEDCKSYGASVSWKVKAIFETKGDAEKKKEELEFENYSEYQDYVEKHAEEKEVIQVKDDIKYTYKGVTYTPGHFLKNMRYEGKMLREQFQVNYVKDNIKPLPPEEKLKAVKKSDEYKDLVRMVRIARQCSRNRDEFIGKMNSLGVKVTWTDNRKYITFEMPKTEKYRGGKYRNRSFVPEKSYTKEGFEQVFLFNQKMQSIIQENKIASFQELKNLAAKNSISGFRLSEEGNRVYLRMEFLEEKVADSNARKTKNSEKEMEKVERESYFDEEAILRFLKDKTGQDIVMPSMDEIIMANDKKKSVIFETEEGYLFSGSSLSRKFTLERLEQRFYNNMFAEKRKDIVEEIRGLLYQSKNWDEFSKNLQEEGFKIEYRSLTRNDYGNCAMKETRKLSEEEKALVFTTKDGISFEGTFASKGFTEEHITVFLEENRKRMTEKEMNETFRIFTKILDSKEDWEAEQINRKNIVSREITGQALKDKRKEKGYER